MGKIDWTRVPVNTKVTVTDKDGVSETRYFIFYAPESVDPFFVFSRGVNAKTFKPRDGRCVDGKLIYPEHYIEAFPKCRMHLDFELL